jgi:hypothetical protein
MEDCCRGAQAETERAPKLLGSRFIKQVSSNLAEPREQGGFLIYHLEQVTEKGGTACPIHSHMLFYWLL